MAFGRLKGTLTGNATTVATSNSIAGSVSVAVGDLIFAVFAEASVNGSTGATDNLGNTYTAQNAGTLSTIAGRAFWSIATVGGTLTSVAIAATSGSHAWAGFAAVIEGYFLPNASQPDTNPANNTGQTTSPFSAPATGVLSQTPDVIMAWSANIVLSGTWSATSPNLLAGQATQGTAAKAVLGYQAVTATTSVTPQFTSGTNPSSNVMGTISFKGNPVPFNSMEQNRPRSVQAATAMAVLPVSLALLAPVTVSHNTPRSPVIGRPAPMLTAVSQLLGSPAALLTPTQNPFSLTDWSVPARVKSAPQQGYPPYNPNLYTNPIPFGPYDYNIAHRLGPSKQFDPQPNYPNFYPNPIPFGPYDYSKPPIRVSPPPPQHPSLNLELYTNPVPFGPFDWSKPFPVAAKASDVYQPYSNFYGPVVAANPVVPYDTTKPWPVTSSPPQAVPYNPNLFTPPVVLPVALRNAVVSKPYVPIYTQALSDQGIIENIVPFALYDWSKPAPFPPKAADVYQSWQNFYTVVTAPFIAYDFQKPLTVRSAPPQATPYNLNLFTNPIPFGPYDWSARPQFTPRAPPQPVERNPLIYSEVPRTFFDWSKAVGVRSTPVQPQPYNVLLYAQPFLTFDFGPARRVPSVPPGVPLYNLNLLAPPVVTTPFGPFDWSKPYALRPSVPQAPQNLTLFLPPPVIVGIPGLAFSKDIPVALFRAYETAAVAARTADFAAWKSKAADIAAAQATAKDIASFTVKASDSPSGQNWSGAGYMAQYEIDTTIELQGIFVNALSGVYADPTTITLYIEDPTGTITTQTWPGGNVVRDSLGHFHYILTPALNGNWTYKWRGFGTVQATSPDTAFTVNASAFLP